MIKNNNNRRGTKNDYTTIITITVIEMMILHVMMIKQMSLKASRRVQWEIHDQSASEIHAK